MCSITKLKEHSREICYTIPSHGDFCISLFTLATPMLLQSSSGIKYHVRIVLSSRVENQLNLRDNSIFSIVVGIQEHPLTSCYILD